MENNRMRVGVSIIQQLSSAFYSRKNMVIEELISNSYDAYADKVEVKINPESIEVIDDGVGMSPEELTKFFYISYTEKQRKPAKKIRDKLKRYIIGKFGIGKLSMYQLCHKFTIRTWKNGTESKASFDFDDFEKREFIDEIILNVSSSRSDKDKHGTHLILENLRDGVSFKPNQLRRYLSNRLFFNPDFQIIVNTVPLANAEDKESFYHFGVDEDIPEVGSLKGIVKYLPKNLLEHQAGIYVRVKGRVVNHNPRLIDFSQLTAALILSRRIWGYIDADGLEDALQSNRSDFIADHPKYFAFISWLKKKLNRENEQAISVYSQLKRKSEKEDIPKIMAADAAQRWGPENITDGSEKENDSEEANSIPSKFELVNLSDEGPEAEFDVETRTISINIDHPLYERARKKKCLEYHILKATIVAIAAQTSKSIEEFLKKYDYLSKSGEIPSFRKK